MAFMIKQHDRRPYLTGQITESDNVTPVNLTLADDLHLIMRLTGTTGAPLFRKPCSITDAAQGEWLYAWGATDTAVSGTFDAELEITWPGPEPQTVPADGYYTIIVLDDLDD